jgi:hypothetical protein
MSSAALTADAVDCRHGGKALPPQRLATAVRPRQFGRNL